MVDTFDSSPLSTFDQRLLKNKSLNMIPCDV